MNIKIYITIEVYINHNEVYINFEVSINIKIYFDNEL